MLMEKTLDKTTFMTKSHSKLGKICSQSKISTVNILKREISKISHERNDKDIFSM